MKTLPYRNPPAIYGPLSQPGVSIQALQLLTDWRTLYTELAGRCASGAEYAQILVSLATLAREAAHAGWDGYGAAPINPDSLAYAKRLVQILSFNLGSTPTPDVSVDPDGEVSFDWDGGAKHHLSFSVSPGGAMRYAGIAGGSEAYGTEPWRDGIPETIVRLLQEVVSARTAERLRWRSRT